VVQGVGVSLTVGECKYCVIGKVCTIMGALLITGAGTTGTAIELGSLPVARPGWNDVAVGTWFYWDANVGPFSGVIKSSPVGTVFNLMYHNGWFGQTPNFATANSDTLGFTASYRVS